MCVIVGACGGDDKSSATPTPTPAASVTATPLATNGGIVPPSATADAVTYATAATDNERVVSLLESGYTAEKGLLSGGVVLHNRNRSEAVVVPYTVELIAGGTLSAISQNVVLLPDESIGDAFDQAYMSNESSASIKVSVQLASAEWVAFDLAERLTVSHSPVEAQSIVGEIDNPFDEETGPLRISVLGRNSDGKIVTGIASAADSIRAHSTGQFEADAVSPLPASVPITWEAYVSFADDFPAWMTAQ